MAHHAAVNLETAFDVLPVQTRDDFMALVAVLLVDDDAAAVSAALIADPTARLVEADWPDPA